MKKLICILAVAAAAALLFGGLWFLVNSGAFHDFDRRLLMI